MPVWVRVCVWITASDVIRLGIDGKTMLFNRMEKKINSKLLQLDHVIDETRCNIDFVHEQNMRNICIKLM